MTSKKLVSLTISEKVQIIELNEKSKVPVKSLVKQFNCGKTVIYDTLKNKEKILDEWLTGNGAMKRKLKITGNEEINKLVWEWFVNARSKNLPVSGPILQAQAMDVAQRLDVKTFKASTGWLNSFRQRHAIVWNTVCGEGKDVDGETVASWKDKLQNIVAGYEAKDIYNGDETGLFYRAFPNKTLCLRGEKCTGGKISKERLTIFVCGNMCGDLEMPLVIGKAKKPRCFNNVKIQSLPVIWRNNTKSWMTCALMEEWLISFNQRMARQNRRVLLFLDNAACHPHIKLSNVKLIFLPPNTTSHSQPMDQGVIFTFKSHYRRLLLQSLIPKLNACVSINELAKEISVLDAIQWTATAIKRIQRSTIEKCFLKAGFPTDNSISNSTVEEASDNLQVIKELCQEIPDFECDAAVYVNLDEELVTERTFESAADLLQDLESGEKDEDECEECSEQEFSVPTLTHTEAISRIQELLDFSLQHSYSEAVQSLYQVKTQFEGEALLKPKTQRTLTEMWKEKE